MKSRVENKKIHESGERLLHSVCRGLPGLNFALNRFLSSITLLSNFTSSKAFALLPSIENNNSIVCRGFRQVNNRILMNPQKVRGNA